jgi:hypothetical protein
LLGTTVNAIATYNNRAYFAGSLTALPDGSRTLNNIVAWNGSDFFTLPGTLSMPAYAMTVFNSKLIVSGHFSGVGNRIAAYDGSSWSTLGAGGTNGLGNFMVFALAVFGGKLYAGGQFNRLGDNSFAYFIASWSGSAWATLPCGNTNGLNGFVYALSVFQNKLYIGGAFTTLMDNTPARRIVAWDGSAWSFLASGASNGVGGDVRALAVFNSRLFLGGSFTSLSDGTSANRIAAWSGTAFTTLPAGGSNGFGGTVNVLYNTSTQLLIGGAFTSLSDGSRALYVATWDDSVLKELETATYLTNEVKAMAEFGGRVLIGGTFTAFSDGSPANLVAYV